MAQLHSRSSNTAIQLSSDTEIQPSSDTGYSHSLIHLSTYPAASQWRSKGSTVTATQRRGEGLYSDGNTATRQHGEGTAVKPLRNRTIHRMDISQEHLTDVTFPISKTYLFVFVCVSVGNGSFKIWIRFGIISYAYWKISLLGCLTTLG